LYFSGLPKDHGFVHRVSVGFAFKRSHCFVNVLLCYSYFLTDDVPGSVFDLRLGVRDTFAWAYLSWMVSNFVILGCLNV
jgi:hypothetical protein